MTLIHVWIHVSQSGERRRFNWGRGGFKGAVITKRNPWSRCLINAPQDCCFRYDWTLTDLLSPVYSFLRSWANPPFILCSKFPMSIPSCVRTCIRQYTAYIYIRTIRACTTVRDTCTIPDRMASFLDCFVWGETTSSDIVMNSPTRVYVFQGKAVLKCAYLKCIILQLESSTLQ